MTAWQRRLQLALVACAVLAFALGTTKGKPSSPSPPTAQPSTAPASFTLSDPTPRIAILYDTAGRGTAGFNELAWAGIKRAADAFDAELVEITAKPDDTDADRVERLTELAKARYYPIFVIGSTYASAVAKVAPKYPSIWFAMLDDGSVDGPHVLGILFNEEQGSFLVGAAAALTSKTGTVGFIGAVQIPLLQKYEAGFTAGARAANPKIKVQVTYLSRPADYDGVTDAGEARRAALAMYDAGADVIFGTAGGSSTEVIEAAHDRGLWAIGVDSDQYRLSDQSVRGAVLTSMLKRADVVAFTATMEVANGVAKDGNNRFGVDVDGVGYSTSGGFVDPIKVQLDAFAARIAAGEILVPTKP